MIDAGRYWSALMFYFIFVVATAIGSGILFAVTLFMLFAWVFIMMMLGIMLGLFMIIGVMLYETGASFDGFYGFFKKHWDIAMGIEEEQ